MKKINLLFSVFLFLGIITAKGQYNIVYNFGNDTSNFPYGGLTLSHSNDTLFGVADGGTYNDGVIFRIDTNGTGYRNLFSFNGTNGYDLAGSLIFSVSGDTLFGMAGAGGTNNYGTIFSIRKNGSDYTILHNFSITDGIWPSGGLTLSGKILYGLTPLEGAYVTGGTLFSIHTDGSGYTVLHNFGSITDDGNQPFGNLTLSKNVLYGMTTVGGTNGDGTIFSIDTDGSNYSILHNFNDTDGSQPSDADLVLSGNILYGGASGGGIYDDGVLFSIHTDGADYSVLHNFNDTDGGLVEAAPLLLGNTLYGVTQNGGTSSNGVLYSIETNGSNYTVLNNFNSTTGYPPKWGVVNSGNKLYGLAEFFGAINGVLYSYDINLNISISSVTNIACNGGYTGSVTVTATDGATPYTYSWAPVAGSNSTLSGLTAGTYTVTVTDNEGKFGTGTVIITQPASLNISTRTITNVSCHGNNGSVSATVTGGVTPYTYIWTPVSYNSSTLTGLSAGTYTIFAVDNNGCIVLDSATVDSLNVTVKVTNVSCTGGHDGSLLATAHDTNEGAAPYTYSWSPVTGTKSTLSGLSAGTYTVTLTDHGGCTATAAGIIASVSVSASVTANVLCNGGNNGSVLASPSGGTLTYTYSWSPVAGSNSTLTGLTAGTYTITLTDSSGCSQTAKATVTQHAVLTAGAITADNVSCYEGSDGLVKTTGVTGGITPYTYSWSPVAGSNSTLSGITAGTYTVTLTDNNGCSETPSTVVTQPTLLRDSVASIVYPESGCVLTGSATIGVTGGTPPYKYTWSPNVSTTSSATGLTVRGYVVQVKDAKNCYNNLNFSITQPHALRDSIVSAATVNVSCNGGNNGSATAGVKYGTPPYTYLWSDANSQTTATAVGLSAGTYTVIVGDLNGCSASASAIITQPSNSIIVHDTCILDVRTVTASGGTAPYTFAWTPAPSGTITNTSTTSSAPVNSCSDSYTITVTDNTGNCHSSHRPVEQRTSVSSTDGSNAIILYPNPNTGQFTLSGLQTGMILEMYDYTGKKISSITSNNETMQLNIFNQADGVYLIRILDKDGNLAGQKKVVKMQ